MLCYQGEGLKIRTRGTVVLKVIFCGRPQLQVYEARNSARALRLSGITGVTSTLERVSGNNWIYLFTGPSKIELQPLPPPRKHT